MVIVPDVKSCSHKPWQLWNNRIAGAISSCMDFIVRLLVVPSSDARNVAQAGLPGRYSSSGLFLECSTATGLTRLTCICKLNCYCVLGT